VNDGPVRFSRYAYPPNALGYCGPDRATGLLEQTAAALAGPELRELARGFDGAWPYLELIATANGIEDPLDARVVEAYWLGAPLLDRVPTHAFGQSLRDRFAPRTGRHWRALRDAPLDDAVPHHNFHVFVVYPWVGLLRHGDTGEPLRVLDQCRIRPGTVEHADGDLARVRVRPLRFDGWELSLGDPTTVTATLASAGLGLAGDVQPGDRVSLHWDWVCERLTAGQAAMLDDRTRGALALANEVLRRPAGSLLG
jgi:hypothetical protein